LGFGKSDHELQLSGGLERRWIDTPGRPDARWEARKPMKSKSKQTQKSTERVLALQPAKAATVAALPCIPETAEGRINRLQALQTRMAKLGWAALENANEQGAILEVEFEHCKAKGHGVWTRRLRHELYFIGERTARLYPDIHRNWDLIVAQKDKINGFDDAQKLIGMKRAKARLGDGREEASKPTDSAGAAADDQKHKEPTEAPEEQPDKSEQQQAEAQGAEPDAGKAAGSARHEPPAEPHSEGPEAVADMVDEAMEMEQKPEPKTETAEATTVDDADESDVKLLRRQFQIAVDEAIKLMNELLDMVDEDPHVGAEAKARAALLNLKQAHTRLFDFLRSEGVFLK
jgi:hypothetical protein